MFDRIRNLLRIRKAYGQFRDLVEQPGARDDMRRWAKFWETVFSIVEVREMLEKLSGYKTYILSALGVLTVVAWLFGWITDEQAAVILPACGFGGLMALRAGVKKSGPVVLPLVLLWPIAATAQTPLLDTGLRLATSPAYAPVRAQDDRDPLPVPDGALAAAKWCFIGTQTVSTVYGGIKAHQNDEDTLSKVMLGAGATAGGLTAAEYLPERWQRFTALLAASVVTGYVNGRAIVRDIQAAHQAGVTPPPGTVTARRFAVAYTVRR